MLRRRCGYRCDAGLIILLLFSCCLSERREASPDDYGFLAYYMLNYEANTNADPNKGLFTAITRAPISEDDNGISSYVKQTNGQQLQTSADRMDRLIRGQHVDPIEKGIVNFIRNYRRKKIELFDNPEALDNVITHSLDEATPLWWDEDSRKFYMLRTPSLYDSEPLSPIQKRRRINLFCRNRAMTLRDVISYLRTGRMCGRRVSTMRFGLG